MWRKMYVKGGILGGAHHYWSDPFLNSIAILFDIYDIAILYDQVSVCVLMCRAVL